jgi:hypothetical protein
MRRDRHDPRENETREQQEQNKALTLGEISQGIEKGILPAQPRGDEYIVRRADAVRLRDALAEHPDLLDGRPKVAPDHEPLSLQVGRSA